MISRFILFSLLVFITCTKLLSQSRGYIQNDSFYRQGVITLPAEGTAYQIEFQQNRRTPKINYTPADIREFGLGDNTVFFSKVITLEGKPTLVFLERLTKPGQLSIYKYAYKKSKKLFIQQDSTGALKELNTNALNLQAQLIEVTGDMEFAAEKAHVLSYNAKLITLYAEHYNKKLNYPFLPVLRVGFKLGLDLRQLTFSDANLDLSNYLEAASFKQSSKIAGGIFIEIPVLPSKNTFLQASLLYTQHQYLYHRTNPAPTFDLGFNISTFSTPLQVKQYFPMRGKLWVPYLALGGFIDFNQVTEDFLLITQRSPDRIDFQYLNPDEISPSTLGLIGTLGVQYPLFKKHYFFAEVNGGKSLGETYGKLDRYQNFNILTGLSFRL